MRTEFRRCLEQCDVAGARAIWLHVAPHLPQPMDDSEVLTTIHCARTAAGTIPFRLRAYSHAWLTERGLPSGLPDKLRPRAERMYPRVVEGVGIAVLTSPARRELGRAIERAMTDAVAECYADGDTEPSVVRARVQEARVKVLRGD